MNPRLASKIRNIGNVVIPVLPFVIFTIVQFFPHAPNYKIEKFVNYELFFQPILIAIQIAIGLVGLITIFYLGKIHDYKREFFKYEVDVVFGLSEAETIFKPVLEELKVKEHSKLFEKIPTLFEDVRKMYFHMPNDVLSLALGCTALYAYGLFVLIYSREDASLSGFIGSIFALMVGIALFIRVWISFERMIASFDFGFRVIVSILRFCTLVRDNKQDKEFMITSFKKLVQFLKSQEESNVPTLDKKKHVPSI